MRTMYFTEERFYTDCEGRSSEYRAIGQYDTIEEAKAKTADVKKNCGYDTGDWRIVAKTLDETTFTVTEEVVESYDWWEMVGRYNHAEKMAKYYAEDIEKLENSKKNCKTEKGLNRKNAEIERYKNKLAEMENILKERVDKQSALWYNKYIKKKEVTTYGR